MAMPIIQQNITGNNNIFSATGDVNVYNNTYVNQLTPAAKQEIANLRILLDKVKTFWVKGVLEKSLDQAVLIDLGKETQNQAVDHPWSSVVELPDNTNHVVPQGTNILDIFDQANHALLILGEPGSGKTTTLLELTRALIQRAENDPQFSQPIPVVFKLSSWANYRKPLVEWMIEELSKGYQVNKRMGKPWLEQNRLLPLFDGLDEVNAEHRAACVKAINEFCEAYGLSGLVVSCRLTEYTALPLRLKMNEAICLQKLTSEQINTYLSAAGEKLSVLQATLQKDEALQALAQSPLVLNVMCLAYSGVSANELTIDADESIEKRRGRIFDTYIDRMFKRRGNGEQTYSREETIKWLKWLAVGMLQNNQPVFLIENLQPSWLPKKPQRWGYVLLSRNVTITALVTSLMASIMVSNPSMWTNTISILAGILTILATSTIGGIIYGLPIGFVDALRVNLFLPNGFYSTIPWQRILYKVFNVLIVGLFLGLIDFIVFDYVGRLSHVSMTLGALIDVSAISGLMFGLIFGIRGGKQKLTDDVQTTESLSWSWAQMVRGAGVGFILSGIFNLLATTEIWGLLYSQYETVSKITLIQTIFFYFLQTGVLGVPFGMLFGGITRRVLIAKTYPNQGTWLSIKNACLIAPLGGLCAIISSGLLLLFGVVKFGSLILPFLFIITACASLWYGGADAIQHYVLRFFLWYGRCMPPNYARFLDYTSDLIFLRKVGGGYIFIHRMLQEHLASSNK